MMKDGIITNEKELRDLYDQISKIARMCDSDQNTKRVTEARYWSGYNDALNIIAPLAQKLKRKIGSILIDSGCAP